jgi:arylsulfatase A-like enzyme
MFHKKSQPYLFYIIYNLTVLLVLNVNCRNVYSYPFQYKDQINKDSEFSDAHNYNIILVCLDTLRADHLGCYGYFRDTSPNIDKLAKDGILFEWAFAQSSFTLPSHASLFTSKYVHSHKADRIERRLSEEDITLAEVLKSNGYKTAAFIYNAVQFNPLYGINQGFEIYDYGGEKDKRPSFEKTLPAALKWIEQYRDAKFFVFLHSNDIHEPYHSPLENFFDPHYKGRLDSEYLGFANPFFSENNLTRTPDEIKHIIAHYDGGIKYADSFVGRFMKQLKDWDLLDKTIIILISDHGEILADRGMRFCHGFSLHDEEVRVPLIIRHPQLKKGIRIDKLVQLVDVMPTILDFLGIEKGIPEMEGRSLVNVIEGKGNPDEYVYAECISGESQKEGAINLQRMVRTSSWKLISSIWIVVKKGINKSQPKTIKMPNGAIISFPGKDEYELYDLKKDPKEMGNLINQEDKKIKEIENELLNKLLTFF